MSQNRDLADRAKRAFTPNYQPAPMVLDHGEGAWVFDVEGRRYLDMVAGIAVSALGHGHPRLVEAIRAQAGRILHTSNLYLNQPSIELAEKIVVGSFAERVYFCNSGAEANETALKLARRYAWDRGERSRHEIITFEHSFHGRTYGALTATAQPKYHEGFAPMLEGFKYLPHGDAAALEAAVSDQTAAIFVEPIQGEGGVREWPAGFLAACRRIASERGALLMFDEVQTGVGRTGTLFAHQGDGVIPDVMTLAKGIGGGVPLGAMVTTEAVGRSLAYGTHATTYGGNPLACAAGSVVFDVLAEPGFLESVRANGQRLKDGLRQIGEAESVFSEVRGRGLLVGAVVRPDAGLSAKDVVIGCRERGVLVHVAGPEVVRLAPPLIVSEAQVDEALGVIREVVRGRRASS